MAKPTAKHAGGRPKKITSPDDLQVKVDAYFLFCEQNILPPTMQGLAIALGIDRDTLLRYSKQAEFYGTIKGARDKVCHWVEKELLFRSTNVTGLIFWLKNNAGWKDEQHQRHSFDFSKLSDEELEAIAAGQSEA